ncbi:MAG: CoA transferase [Emcibacter sp.]|nr:CoA transferase [Emcibacter sp.]
MVLGGLKVIDFSWSVPGPYCSLYLADMGANVVRIESAVQPEIFRNLAPMDGKSSYCHRYLNRNKDCIAVDLRNEEDATIVRNMLREADILIEQFRPGVMERLGFGYEALRALNPALIYCSISGYGQSGTYSQRAGHDINYFALSGVAASQMRPAVPPMPLSYVVADVAGGGLHGVIGIMMALRHRDQTGEGQHVDVSMTDAVWAMNAVAGPAALDGNEDENDAIAMLNGSSVYNYYETKDGRFLAVGSIEEKFRWGLCEALGREDLEALALQSEDHRPFCQALKEIFYTEDLIYWQALFRKYDVCVEPVLSIAEAASHEHFVTRGSVVDVPFGGDMRKQFSHPIRYSAIKPDYRHAGKDQGSDTEAYKRKYSDGPERAKD